MRKFDINMTKSEKKNYFFFKNLGNLKNGGIFKNSLREIIRIVIIVINIPTYNKLYSFICNHSIRILSHYYTKL